MLSSISGQNDYWAQAAALQSPIQQPSQNGAWGSTSATTAPSASTTNPPPTGGTTAPLSDPMSSMMMALFGGWGSSGWGSTGLGNAVATASQAAGQSAAAGNASPSTATAPASGGTSQTEAVQAGTAQAGTAALATVPASLPSPASQLATDLQSLLTALNGPHGESAASTGTTGSGIASSAVASGATAESGAAAASPTVSASLLQDLQKVASDLNTIGRASGPRRYGQDAAPQSAPPPSSNDISNTGTATENGTAGAGGWNPSYRDAFQQQFATAAYSASAQSAATATTAPLTGINV